MGVDYHAKLVTYLTQDECLNLFKYENVPETAHSYACTCSKKERLDKGEKFCCKCGCLWVPVSKQTTVARWYVKATNEVFTTLPVKEEIYRVMNDLGFEVLSWVKTSGGFMAQIDLSTEEIAGFDRVHSSKIDMQVVEKQLESLSEISPKVRDRIQVTILTY